MRTLPNIRNRAESWSPVRRHHAWLATWLQGRRRGRVRAAKAAKGVPYGQMHFWPLTEMGGPRYDLIGSVNLTDHNSVNYYYYGGRAGAHFYAPMAQYLSCAGTLLRFQNPFSFSFWATVDNRYGDYVFVSKDSATYREFVIETGYDAVLTPYIYTPATGVLLYSGAPLTVGAWFQVAVTFDGARLTYYINGAVNNFGFGTPTQTDTEFRLGARVYQGFEGYHNGALAEFRMWDRALSDLEIAQLYNHGNGLPNEVN